MNEVLCIKCNQPAAFPKLVSQPYICTLCQRMPPEEIKLLPCPFCGMPEKEKDGEIGIKHKADCYFIVWETELDGSPVREMAWNIRAEAFEVLKVRRNEVKVLAEELRVKISSLFIEQVSGLRDDVSTQVQLAIELALIAVRTPNEATKELMEDKARLDWYENNSTLHKEIEILYLVDCYEVTLINDRNGTQQSYRGDSLRTAISNAMKQDSIT